MFEAFISFKNLDPHTGQQTRDSQIAQRLYDSLTKAGVNAFFSNVEVQRSSDARWGKLIDSALREAKVIIVVGTRLDYIESEWVEYEWRYFSEQIRTGKNKQMLTVLEGLSPAALPPAFTQVQSYSPAHIEAAVDKVLWILGKQKPARKAVEETEIAPARSAQTQPAAQVKPVPPATVTPVGQTVEPARKSSSISAGKFVAIAAVFLLVIGLIIVPMLNDGEEPTLTPSTVPTGNYPPEFTHFSGSSYYYIDDNNKGLVSAAFDGDISTSWQDGVEGYGEGEWLMAKANAPQAVSSVTIWNGYQNPRYPHLYADNARVNKITVFWEDGQQSFEMRDTKEAQTFFLDSAVVTKFIKIQIDSVYPGERADEFQETVIAEISFG